MKIHGIGLPFSPHQSSCSNRTPTNFTWTDDKDEECDIQVWVDRFISNGILEKRMPGVAKYAWICESNAIITELREGFDNTFLFDSIISAYDGIFTCEQELVDKHEKIHFCFAGSNLPWTPERNYKIYDKTEFCSFISSRKKMTEGQELRHRLYNILKVRHEGDKIVSLCGGITEQGPFGLKYNCHSSELSLGDMWHDKSFGLNNFMFSIVIENSQYDDYFTEKITDCFATGIIPLYYGTKNIGKYFNMDGIIEISDDETLIDFIISNRLNKDLYYSKMDAIKDNLERVKNMQMADDMLFDKIQELKPTLISIKGSK